MDILAMVGSCAQVNLARSEGVERQLRRFVPAARAS
jgi:hypothetical protein